MPLVGKRSLPHNGSISPIIGTTSPSTTPTPQHDTQRLQKIRRFLGALIQFGQDTNQDIGERLRSLVLSLTSGGLTVDDFQIAVQEATNFPLRPNVLPFLRLHLPLLQREVHSLSRACKQSPLQYVRGNENSVLEMLHNSTDHSEIFANEIVSC